MEGGSANDYDYVGGDPVNGRDLDGRCGFPGNPFQRCQPAGASAGTPMYGGGSVGPPPPPEPSAPNNLGSRALARLDKGIRAIGSGIATGARAAGRVLTNPVVSGTIVRARTYWAACTAGASAGAYLGLVASVATSGGLDSPLLVPTTTALGCITAVQYQVLNERLG